MNIVLYTKEIDFFFKSLGQRVLDCCTTLGENYVNTLTDVVNEFRDGPIPTSSGRQFQVWTESGTKE